jgi:ribosomal protein S8
MSDVFTAAAEDFVNQSTQDSASQAETPQNNAPDSQAPQASATDATPKGDVAMAIAELDKMDKFKLDGQEWTLKDLKAAIMRQKDYTQKTQSLAEERKSFQEERKFHENLAWDLQQVRDNPELAKEFVKIYPQSFHKHVAEFLKASTQVATQQNQNQVQKPQVDIELLSRLDRLEKIHSKQEIAQEEAKIEKTVDELSKKYPDAANFKELVLSRAYEARLSGNELTTDDWEKIFKEVDEQVGTLVKAKYGNLVKQQTEANSKAKDVGAGGGTAGRAPVKFKNFDQLQKHAEEISRGG